ncbi:MAG: hypothetical protein GYB53_20995 [Rhodobacteraceae bacterium]|nr:hypothetical protein [Paracoccaceae bacterium]
MKVLVWAALPLLAACSMDMGRASFSEWEGSRVGDLIAKVGYPDAEANTACAKRYSWIDEWRSVGTIGNETGQHVLTCTRTVYVSGDVIVEAKSEGAICSRREDQFRR